MAMRTPSDDTPIEKDTSYKPFKDAPRRKNRCCSFAESELNSLLNRCEEKLKPYELSVAYDNSEIKANAVDDITKPSTEENFSGIAYKGSRIHKSSFTPFIEQLEKVEYNLSKSKEDSKGNDFARECSSSQEDDADEIPYLVLL